MRPMFVVSVLAVVLLVASLRGRSFHPGPRPPHAFEGGPAVAENTPKAQPWRVTGYGKDRADAEADAWEKAQQQVADYLAGLNPPVEWRPSPEYVKELAKQPPEVEGPEERAVGKVYKVTLTVDVGSHLQDILKHDRHHRMEVRQLLLAKVLGGLVVLLAVVALYFRLEEYTKGYYTTWLRLTALGLLAVTGVGVWWLW
jgi:hypothetical protein